MKFFSIAYQCEHEAHSSNPIIAFDDDGEFIPIFRSRQLAELAAADFADEQIDNKDLLIKEFEVRAV